MTESHHPAVLPRQMFAAANELVLCLAAVVVRGRIHRGGTISTTEQGLIARLHRAITGLVQFEGGRFTVTWGPMRTCINDYELPQHEKLVVANRALRKSLGARGILGIAFRLIPDEDQLRHFFRRVLSLQLEDVQELGDRGSLAQLPGERDLVGILLLVGHPGDETGSHPGRRSGIGLRVAFEESLADTGLDWIGRSPRAKDDETATQRFCLGVYTNLVSSSLRFVRLARAIRDGHTPFPALALARLVESVGRAYAVAPELMNACVLLGARDPAPARRIAHTAALTIGLAHHRKLSRTQVAETGLAAFVYGLRERFKQLGDQAPPELTILQLLAGESALTSHKVRAIYGAALVGSDGLGAGASIQPPMSARLVELGWAAASALDGTLTASVTDAPVPMSLAYAALTTRYANGGERAKMLGVFARWMGPAPAGTVVQLPDGRVAVVTVSQGAVLRATPLLGAGGEPLEQPTPPVRIGRRDERGNWPDRLDVEGIVATRPVVDRAAGALFYRARKTWQPLVAPPSRQA